MKEYRWLFVCDFVWLYGALALRAKTWVCLNEISKNKHH